MTVVLSPDTAPAMAAAASVAALASALTDPLVVIYVRISHNDVRTARKRSKNDEEFQALLSAKADRHARDCRKYAEGKGWTVVMVFTDNGRSASRLGATQPRKGESEEDFTRRLAADDARRLPEREKLFDWVRAHPGRHIIILVTEVPRLARQKTHGVQIIAMSRNCSPLEIHPVRGRAHVLDRRSSDGETSFMDAVTDAEHESLIVAERRRDKERDRAEQGGFWGNEPFGSRKITAADEDGIAYATGELRLDKDEAKVIRQAGADVITYKAAKGTPGSMRAVARAWNEAGFTTRQGNPWTPTEVRRLLLNKRLAGIRVHREGDNFGRPPRDAAGIEYETEWPQMFDPATHEQICDILTAEDRRTNAAGNARVHPLTGLAESGKCGGAMRGTTTPGKDGVRIRRYVCTTPDRTQCGCTTRVAAPAEKHVRNVVLYWLRPDGAYAVYVAAEAARTDANRSARTAGDVQRVEEIERQERVRNIRLGEVQAAIRHPKAGEDLDDLREDRVQIRAGLRELATEKAQLNARIGKAELSAKQPPEPEPCPSAGEFDSWSPDDKYAWLSRFAAKVIIRPASRKGPFFDPEDVDVIPGPWADGLPGELLALPSRPASADPVREAVTGWLAANPESTAAQIAAGTGRGRNSVYRALSVLTAAGEVTGAPPPRRAGSSGAPALLFSLGGGDGPSVRMSGPTRDAILAWLRVHPGSTARQIAAGSGAHPVSVQRALAVMTAAGEVTAAEGIRGAKGGNPGARYTLANAAGAA